MIVGFPGETEAGFRKLCQFVQAAQFDRLGVFSYSDEDTSASFALDAKVGARHLQSQAPPDGLQRKISRAKQPRAGRPRISAVLVEGPSADSEWCGRRASRRKRPKSTASATSPIPASSAEARRIRRMRITEAHDYDLTGELDRRAAPRQPRHRSRVLQIAFAAMKCPMKCPICKKKSRSDPELPFCSERCRIIDLGNWARKNT
jgi:ribosomal protein S12 methylthiotransferase